MTPMNVIEWVSKNFGFLGVIAPIFIFYLVVIIGAGLIKGWIGFTESIKEITKTKWRLLFFMLLFAAFMYFWNEFMRLF